MEQSKEIALINGMTAEQYTHFLPAKAASDISDILDYDQDGPIVKLPNGEVQPLMNAYFEMKVIQPGSVRLNQALKGYDKKVWLMLEEEPNNEDCTEDAWLLPIRVLGYSRSKFAQFDNKSSKPLCRSLDGVFPVDSDITPDAPQCAEVKKFANGYRLVSLCPSAKKQNGGKAACTLTLSVAFLDIRRCVPVLFRFRGAGLAAYIAMDGSLTKALNVARIRKRNIGDIAVHLTVADEGTYVRPVLNLEKAPEEFGDLGVYKRLAAFYREQLFVAEEDATVEDAEIVGEETTNNKTETTDVEVEAFDL